jgi:L-lactate dehydrogenase (cytochrome)
MHSVFHAREMARRRLPRFVFDFIEGGSLDEQTLRANRAAFEKVTFVPKSLSDVSHREQETRVLGQDIRLPVLLAPVGMTRLVAREGELAVARAAGKKGTVFVVSTASSFSLEEIAKVATGPLWFQLYLGPDRDLNASLVGRASDSGYHALCLAVDTPVLGKRDRDLRSGLTIPPRLGIRNIMDAAWRFSWLFDFLTGPKVVFGNFKDLVPGKSAVTMSAYVNQKIVNPGATWEDLAWLRDLWKRPLLVKGIMSREDAAKAVELGVDGIVVSNHGGRQLDGLPASLHALTEIADAVRDRAEILLDSGICRGSDVVKAVALGARACLVGRAYLWGLASRGEEGVGQILDVLADEIDRTLALIGRGKLSEVDRSAVRIPKAFLS